MSFSFRALTQWIICFLALCASFFFGPEMYNYANLPQGSVLQVGAALALACALYGWRDTPFSINFFDVAVAGWITWMGISLLWTPDFDSGMNLWAQWLAAAGLMWACGRAMQEAGFIEKVLTMLFISGVVVALIGALQFLLPSRMDWIPVSKSSSGDYLGPSAMFGNRNLAVEYLLLVFPLGWIFFLRARGAFRILMVGLGCALIGVFFAYALSRAGIYFSAFQALLFLGFVIIKRTRILLLPAGWTRLHSLAVACSFVVFLILANLTSSGFQWRWESAAQETEKAKAPLFQEKGGVLPDQRTMLYKNTWAMAQDRPIAGFGLGSFKSIYPAYARKAVVDQHFSLRTQPSETHNDFIQFWAELGIIGSILFVVLWFLFFREAWISLRKPDGVWCIGMGLAGVGLALDAFVNFPMSRGPLPPFVFFVYGALMSGSHQDWKWNAPRRFVSVMSIVCALLCITAVSWNVTRLAADRHLEKSLRASIQQDWPKAFSEIEEARRLQPGCEIILFTAARVYAALGDKARAVATYEQGLKEYPYSVNELWNTCMGYKDLNKLDEALTYCQKAIAILPEEASFYFQLGFLYVKRGEIDKAQAAFDETLRIDPGFTLMMQP